MDAEFGWVYVLGKETHSSSGMMDIQDLPMTVRDAGEDLMLPAELLVLQ